MTRVIEEDTRQHAGKHDVKHGWWTAHGVSFEERTRALPFADYTAEGSNVAVDTKASIHELMGNLGAEYQRLDHECRRAAEAGYRIVFLAECGGKYANPAELRKVASKFCMARCELFRARKCDPTDEDGSCNLRGMKRKPFQGYQLMGRMKSLHEKYGAQFEFVEPDESARRICELLGVSYEQEGAETPLDRTKGQGGLRQSNSHRC